MQGAAATASDRRTAAGKVDETVEKGHARHAMHWGWNRSHHCPRIGEWVVHVVIGMHAVGFIVGTFSSEHM